MKDEEVREKLDRIQEVLERLNERRWEKFSTCVAISRGISAVKDVKKAYFTPERPETCDGFYGNCERKPSKYHRLHDEWLCIGCWNEKVNHYSG